MKAMWKNVMAFWSGLEKTARTGLIVGIAAIVIAVAGLGYWLLRSDYKVLFADLDERDASAIVEELKRNKIDYRLEDEGRRVLVDGARVHETRLKLMGKGIALNGGVGFEIFDNKDVGMTEYTQKIHFQRALQGELARTIMAIEQVKVARVHLVIPETSIFRRQAVSPKASISLVLRPGATLHREQIDGIQRLVAASVPGLDSRRVTILDQKGTVLSSNVETDEKIEAASGKLRMKKEVEAYLARKIVEVMDRAFGAGQAIVSVDVAMNFDDVKRTQEDVVPLQVDGKAEETGAVLRKRQSIHRQAGAGPSTRVSDGGDYQAPAPYVTSTTEVEYELGKRVEQVVSTPGGIQRVSVGVIVPPGVGTDQIDKVRALVGTVVGFNASRGDAITVQAIDALVGTTGNEHPDREMVAGSSGRASELSSTTVADWIPDPVREWLGRLGLASGQQSLLLFGVLAFFLLFAGWIAGRMKIARKDASASEASSHSLSAEERHAKLAEIQAWISAEKAKAAEGAGHA